jgi:peptide/nickel transport system ATP-binding protein
MPDECPFLPRCPKATNVCRSSPVPALSPMDDGHFAACYNPIYQEVDAAVNTTSG